MNVFNVGDPIIVVDITTPVRADSTICELIGQPGTIVGELMRRRTDYDYDVEFPNDDVVSFRWNELDIDETRL